VEASERREIPGSLKSLVSFARDLRICRGRMRAAIHYQWDQFRVGAGAAGFHRVLPSLSTWPPRRTATRSKEGEVGQTTPPRPASKEGSGPLFALRRFPLNLFAGGANPDSPGPAAPPLVITMVGQEGCPGAQGRRTGSECELDGGWVQEEPAPKGGPVLLSSLGTEPSGCASERVTWRANRCRRHCSS